MRHEARRREAHSYALVHPQHVLGLRSPNPAWRRHFPGWPNPLGEGGYPTMISNRIHCISLKINDRDTFYPTINRGVFATIISRRVPLSSAQTSVKPCQMFFALTYSKQRIETQNKCQEIAIAFRTLSRPLSARIRASNSGYDGTGIDGFRGTGNLACALFESPREDAQPRVAVPLETGEKRRLN